MTPPPPLHDFPLNFLKWSTKKDRRYSNRPSTPLAQSKPEPEPETEPEPESEPEAEPEEVEAEIQWNSRLRKRGSGTAEMTAVDSNAAEEVQKPTRYNSGSVGRERKRFWIALSKEEIEQDIYSMTGSKPSRRPRKHSKTVQKHLDKMFPGLWLNGFSPESYRKFIPPAKK